MEGGRQIQVNSLRDEKDMFIWVRRNKGKDGSLTSGVSEILREDLAVGYIGEIASLFKYSPYINSFMIEI